MTNNNNERNIRIIICPIDHKGKEMTQHTKILKITGLGKFKVEDIVDETG